MAPPSPNTTRGHFWSFPVWAQDMGHASASLWDVEKYVWGVEQNEPKILPRPRFPTLHLLSNYAVGAILSQINDNGSDKHIAFASKKLNNTQQGWATIEKESYAAVWALQKYRSWVFGNEIVVHSDNPITYLTEAASKSAKLMRWALAIQEYNVKFVSRIQ